MPSLVSTPQRYVAERLRLAEENLEQERQLRLDAEVSSPYPLTLALTQTLTQT